RIKTITSMNKFLAININLKHDRGIAPFKLVEASGIWYCVFSRVDASGASPYFPFTLTFQKKRREVFHGRKQRICPPRGVGRRGVGRGPLRRSQSTFYRS